MPQSETDRGIEYLRNIIESGKTLKLREPRRVNQGYSYLLQVMGLGKEWSFSLSKENIDDLPGTKAYHATANALARGLDVRFRNVDPNLFVTQGGRLVKIVIDWPPIQWMNGTNYVAATGLWGHLTDLVSQQVARCAVLRTSLQEMSGSGSDPFSRPCLVTNTIRSAIDSGAVKFYASHDDLPRQSPEVRMLTGSYVNETVSVQDYVAKKVWLLGFTAGIGRKEIKAWVADPWDAEYLGCTEADLRRAAAILEAQDKIVLDEDSEFASVGRTLLATDGPVDAPKRTKGSVFQTALDTYTPQGPLGEGGSGKVLRVLDSDGTEHALKYLKPDATSSRKTKRFKNEMAFCTKNSHANIITIEDWGLAEVEGVQVPFYIMPIFSQTLRSLMKKEARPERLLSVFLQVLDGVEEAHKAGIWHRDLKPENVLFDEVIDRAVVTDFGIAHFNEELLHTTIETQPHERLANFRYAAPEQRSKGDVDQRADIYALGLILYELFTGALLQGTQHMRIGAVYPQFSYLDPAVELMTRQSPRDRPASIAAVRGEMGVAHST